MKTIEEINQHNVNKILSEKKIPEFYPGDVVKVGVRITEGKKERIQYFEGVCIAKKSRDLNSSFTVRKISFGEGVERTFPLFGTLIDGHWYQFIFTKNSCNSCCWLSTLT